MDPSNSSSSWHISSGRDNINNMSSPSSFSEQQHDDDGHRPSFFAGSYDHNQVLLQSLTESISEGYDEDRLIRDAAKKVRTAAQPGPQQRLANVVSSAELVSSAIVRDYPTNMETVRMNLHRVFENSTSFVEVSTEQIQRVKVIHNRFMEGAIFSFNYNWLLLISSIIAAIGLGTDSVTIIIASMLVSPIMGPVTGIAYGASIKDFRMVRIAFVTETVSLIICIAIGGLVGLCMVPFDVAEDWPTDEQLSRANLTSLYAGLPVAFFSGLGVAVSLLDDVTSSLVGVAISASLLPPAVNCGMLWVSYWWYERDHMFAPDYTISDFAKGGAISLGLTLTNIVLIIIASMIMFRLKERLPIKNKKVFWEDLGLARKIYRNLAVMPEGVGRRVSMFVQHPFGDQRQSAMSGARNNESAPSIPHGSEQHASNSQLPPVSEETSSELVSARRSRESQV